MSYEPSQLELKGWARKFWQARQINRLKWIQNRGSITWWQQILMPFVFLAIIPFAPDSWFELLLAAGGLPVMIKGTRIASKKLNPYPTISDTECLEESKTTKKVEDPEDV
jgi:hypothetical protein